MMYSSEGGSLAGTTALIVEPTSILTKQKNSMNLRRNTQSKGSDMGLSGGAQNTVHHHREETAVQAIDWRQIGKHSVSHALQGEIKKRNLRMIRKTYLGDDHDSNSQSSDKVVSKLVKIISIWFERLQEHVRLDPFGDWNVSIENIQEALALLCIWVIIAS